MKSFPTVAAACTFAEELAAATGYAHFIYKNDKENTFYVYDAVVSTPTLRLIMRVTK